MCHPGDYDIGFNIRRENHRWVDAGVESVGLIFALTSLLLVGVPLWLECLHVAPHRHVCQKNGHVGAHFSFGAKRLCAPQLVVKNQISCHVVTHFMLIFLESIYLGLWPVVSFTCVWHHISRYIFNFTYQNNLNLINKIEAWCCSPPSSWSPVTLWYHFLHPSILFQENLRAI